MITLLRNFRRDFSGATSIEYALIASIITIGTLVAYNTIGANVDAKMQTAVSAFK